MRYPSLDNEPTGTTLVGGIGSEADEDDFLSALTDSVAHAKQASHANITEAMVRLDLKKNLLLRLIINIPDSMAIS